MGAHTSCGQCRPSLQPSVLEPSLHGPESLVTAARDEPIFVQARDEPVFVQADAVEACCENSEADVVKPGYSEPSMELPSANLPVATVTQNEPSSQRPLQDDSPCVLLAKGASVDYKGKEGVISRVDEISESYEVCLGGSRYVDVPFESTHLKALPHMGAASIKNDQAPSPSSAPAKSGEVSNRPEKPSAKHSAKTRRKNSNVVKAENQSAPYESLLKAAKPSKEAQDAAAWIGSCAQNPMKADPQLSGAVSGCQCKARDAAKCESPGDVASLPHETQPSSRKKGSSPTATIPQASIAPEQHARLQEHEKAMREKAQKLDKIGKQLDECNQQ